MQVSYPEEKRAMVEEALRRFFPNTQKYPEIIYEAMKYSLFSEAKRFRPILTLSAAEALDCDPKKVLPTACAIEFIHTYSLIHDDLPAIDNDDLRRGRPTCHVRFGEDIAILAGDALFAEAFYLTARKQKAEPEQLVQVIGELAEASSVRGMVGGQVVDIISAGKQANKETVEYIHLHKTAKLIAASVRIGAILAKASSEELKKFTDYSVHLGLAFQITDDILDIIGKKDKLGKTPGADLRQNKVTYPFLLGIEESKKIAKEEIDKAKTAITGLDLDIRPLIELADFIGHRQQ